MTVMTSATTFTRTDLTRRTREILEQVRRGRTAIIESYGREQAVLLDPLDFRLLRALASLGLARDNDESDIPLLRRYLDEEVSLGKMAESLGVSRFELMDRFERLSIPINLGPRNKAEALAEVEVARGGG